MDDQRHPQPRLSRRNVSNTADPFGGAPQAFGPSDAVDAVAARPRFIAESCEYAPLPNQRGSPNNDPSTVGGPWHRPKQTHGRIKNRRRKRRNQRNSSTKDENTKPTQDFVFSCFRD